MKKLLHAEIIEKRLTEEQAAQAQRHPITLMVDNVRSLYNVGSMFRTADSAFIQEIILCGYTPHPPRKEIEKTALGATHTVPWRYFPDPVEAVHTLRREGNRIIAVEIADTHRMYDSLSTKDYPLVLIVGNEITGISDEVMALVDDTVEIPMYGVKHSLNVSVATGIVLYEAVKIWKNLLQTNTKTPQ